MNILWITLESILPANSGGRIGVYKRLEYLSKTDKIFLFYPYDDDSEIQYKKELEQYCEEVHSYSRQRNVGKVLLKLMKYPYTVASRDIHEMRKDIKNCLRKNKIDLINVDFPHMCVNLLDINIGVPIVLNEHNIEWDVYRNIAKSKRNLVKKLLYFADSFRLKNYELMIARKLNFSRVTFVSSKDRESMINDGIYDKEATALVPVGADVKVNLFCPGKKSIENKIIFVGKMSYAPNIEAVLWFVKKIFPRIKRAISNVRFYIVGKEPSDVVCNLESKDIIVTGTVDSIENYYQMADLVVLPLKNGGGVKIKLLEAISYKKPIVSTSVGVEGTDFQNNRLIPIKDDEDGFATECIEILKNSNQRKEQVINSYRCFIEKYTWESIGKKYREILVNSI